MELKLHNTLSKKKEVFKPKKKDEVTMYTCGPTVYWHATIGNLRAYVFSDTLRRTLEYNDYKIKQVINVTDVGHLTSDADTGDDKMEVAAKKEKKTPEQIANYYLKEFQEDLEKLNIKKPWKWTKATEHIQEQIELIKKLEKKRFTYETNDGIYYDSTKFANYGKMARLNLENLQEGKRVGMKGKKNKTDFALWKFSMGEKRLQEWDSPWGAGFPGWHVECSAMAMKYLGETIDLHTGGEDHVPVHHTNEIAQSEAATGKKFVNYWLHGAFLIAGGKKVSKSKGGLYTLTELQKKGFDALAYKYLLLQSHYRKQLNFSLQSLEAAQTAYNNIKRKISELRKQKHKGVDETGVYQKNFLEAINDDLNTPKALNIFWKLLDEKDFDAKKKLALLEEFDKVLGLRVKSMKAEKLSVPEEITELLEKREIARKNKNWAEADRLRNKIRNKGFELEDGPEGLRIRKK